MLILLDLLVVGWLPTSEVGLRILETAISQTKLVNLTENDIGGIIILGGSIEGGEITNDRGEVSISSAAERIFKAFELIRKYPATPYIFTGYSGIINHDGISDVEVTKRLITEQRMDGEMAHYENSSRNTYENIIYSKSIMNEFGIRNKDGTLKPWLVVTSAYHMYRSIKVFKKQGLGVIPVLVDYQTSESSRWISFNLVEGARNWSIFLHEVLGLAAYSLTGKISIYDFDQQSLP